jgi:hypothetical protein
MRTFFSQKIGYLVASLGAILAAAAPQICVAASTTTPIQHVVIIFQENISFDHYFATYPVALNPPNEPQFFAHENTPSVNGLGTLIEGQPEGALLTDNPTRAILPTEATRSTRSDLIARRFRLAIRIIITGTNRAPLIKV